MEKIHTYDDLKAHSIADLKSLARSLKVPFTERDNKPTLIKNIYESEQNTILASSEKTEPLSKPVEAFSNPKPKVEKVAFQVMSGSQSHERQDVFASVNGESILIKRNHWVALDKKFVQVFEDAVESVFERDRQDNVTERKVPRFNYQIKPLAQAKEEGLL